MGEEDVSLFDIRADTESYPQDNTGFLDAHSNCELFQYGIEVAVFYFNSETQMNAIMNGGS
ncbi:hypothetical protein OIU79_024186 [Salix purpurea]|uniref:Uncharacterized protein n=1 Tax=Salix purpurea TaxID=77065 RepID=A0A9Q0WAW6_SALPP|nr:hypothetical protein OIU79_024186 [Salix purpurea]